MTGLLNPIARGALPTVVGLSFGYPDSSWELIGFIDHLAAERLGVDPPVP